MNNLILFLNSFFSYIVLLLIIVAVAAVAFIIGRLIRKKMDASKAQESEKTESESI